MEQPRDNITGRDSVASTINLLGSSAADITEFSFADESCVHEEAKTEDSVFELTNEAIRALAETTDDGLDVSSSDLVNSVSDASINPPMGVTSVDSPVSRAYSILGVRFEQGRGTSIIRNDLIKYQPVSNHQITTKWIEMTSCVV